MNVIRMSSSSNKKSVTPQKESGYPKECDYCFPRLEFHDGAEFARHLRGVHSKKEGGSYVCRYGENNVCQKLPLEGVSDVDYEAHIRRFHTCVENSMSAMKLSSPVPDEKSFTLNSFTQNLSSVLADPGRKRADLAHFFTRHWGDSFAPPTSIPNSHLIPPVTAQQFVQYVKSTGKTYKHYKAAKKALLRQQQIAADEKTDTDDLPQVFSSSTFLLSHGPTFSAIFTEPRLGERDALAVTSSAIGTQLREEGTSVETRKAPGAFRDYSTLNSHLESMHDVVDSRLAAKLVSKSDDFWKMVHSYGGLHEELAAAIGDVRRVRSSLSTVSTLICDRTRNIMRLYELREKKQRLLAKLHDISCLRDAQSTVQMMLNQSDYPKAIDCIETSQEVLQSELSAVNCFRHLGSQLHELYGVIGRMMHEDFAQVIQKEFASKSEDGVSIIHEGELSSVTMGLMQVRRYSFILVLRTEIGETIKGIMRQVVKQSIVESGLDLTEFDPTLTQLGDPVRRLSFSDWIRTVDDVTTALFAFCQRLQALQDLMCELADRVAAARAGLDVTSSVEMTSSSVSPTSLASLVPPPAAANSSEQEDVSFSPANSTPSADPSVLFAVEIRSDFHLKRSVGLIAEFGHHCAQLRLCRLLQARSKDDGSQQTTSPGELARVVESVGKYQTKCSEQGWHRTQPTIASPLSNCLQKISIEFIDRFHAQRRTKMGEVLDMELWKAAEVPTVFQRIADSCSHTGLLRNLPGSSDGSTPASSLSMEGEQYVVVSSSLMFVRILADYCECVSALPHFAADISARVVELLKAFNSRCCQLILGAGALQLVGLKTISVRNLALASRSLQLIVRFVPVISAEIETHLKENLKHLLRHFKQVLSDYSDHVNEITSKLVSVIDHHTVNCLASWEVKGSIPSAAFQQICRQLLKFHNGLTGIMPDQQIRCLFEAVHHNFKTNMKQQLAQLGVTPHDSLSYGFVTQDYAFYTNSIRSMVACSEMQFESLNDVIFGP